MLLESPSQQNWPYPPKKTKTEPPNKNQDDDDELDLMLLDSPLSAPSAYRSIVTLLPAEGIAIQKIIV